MDNSKKMLKTAGFMAIATFLAKALGLVRDMLTASFFGTGIEANAFLTATRLPTMLFDIVIGGVISSAFIPVFNSVMEKHSKKEALSFANRFIGMVLLISSLIALLGIVFSDSLISFMAPEFDTETHQLASILSSIMFPMIIFTGLAFSFVGILQSLGEFNIPAIMSLVSNLAVVLYFVLFGKRFGVYGLSITMLVSWLLQVIIQIPSLIKFKFRFRPRINFKDKNIKKAMALALPMLISTWVQPLYTIVNTRLASGIYKGVSSLEYANRLYLVVTGVFSFVITNLIFPKMSRAYALGNKKDSRELLVFSLKLISFVILPVMAMFIVLGKPIIAILYQHGSFDVNDTIRAGSVLSCYAVGMIGMAYNEILSKSFFSMQNSKTPMVNAVISMGANIIAAYTLVGKFELMGLALATAIGSWVNAILNFICINKHYEKLLSVKDGKNLLKMGIVTLIMTACMYAVYIILEPYCVLGFWGGMVMALTSGILGAIVYLFGTYITRVDILMNFLKEKK